MYKGAVQMLGTRANLSFVVSGGGSAAREFDCNPSKAPVPASAAVLRNCRRLQPSRFWILVCGAAFGPRGRFWSAGPLFD